MSKANKVCCDDDETRQCVKCRNGRREAGCTCRRRVLKVWQSMVGSEIWQARGDVGVGEGAV